MTRFFNVRQKGGDNRLVKTAKRRTMSHHLYDPRPGMLRSELPTFAKENPMYINRETGKKIRLLEHTSQHVVVWQPWESKEGNDVSEMLDNAFFTQHREATPEEVASKGDAKVG